MNTFIINHTYMIPHLHSLPSTNGIIHNRLRQRMASFTISLVNGRYCSQSPPSRNGYNTCIAPITSPITSSNIPPYSTNNIIHINAHTHINMSNIIKFIIFLVHTSHGDQHIRKCNTKSWTSKSDKNHIFINANPSIFMGGAS